MLIRRPQEYKVGVQEIREIVELLKTKYNFDFSQYAISSFRRRIIRVLDVYKLKDVEDLLRKLTIDKEFHHEFIEEITVNTTEMFRAPSMWKALKGTIINELKKKGCLTIWHAGCSSGEEVFSMAILLEELGIKGQINIVATDINNKVIEVARKGEYPLRNMKLNEENYKRFGGALNFKKYYTIEGNKASLDSNLLKNVQFKTHDLAQEDPFEKFDIVLCRNVMIYFDKVLQDKVYRLFYDSLKPKGFLVIGSKESMIWCSIKNKFRIINEKERIYQAIV